MEFVVWIAFLIIYSIFQAVSSKNKKQPGKKQPLPEIPGEQPNRPATLQDALREIQEALQQAREPQPTSPPQPEPRPPQPEPRPPAPRPVPATREPEFHSMESTIQERNLEAQTKFNPTFSQKVLEKKTTYEDSFPTTTFSDDHFSHAHPDTSINNASPVLSKGDPKLAALQASLLDQQSIRDAFVLSEILGKPKALQ